MLNVENFPSNLLSKRVVWIFLISFTVILFMVTGWTQFSCYPMVTAGVLPKFCNSQKSKLEIIKDSRTHGNTLMILASNPESDENILRTLTSSLDSPKVANNVKMLQRALAFNSKTPVDVLDALVKSKDVDILTNIAKRSNATPELLREVANNPYADTKNVQKALVENRQAPEDVLSKLANSKELEILWKIAKSQQATVNVLRTVANNPIASNPNLQQLLASNQNISEDVLQNLANSTNPKVLFKVLNNPNASTLVIEKIAENSITWENFSIQISLAEKKDVPDKLMKKLAESDDGSVLWALSQNPALPSDLKNIVVKKLEPSIVFYSEPFQQPYVQEPLPNPFSENQKNNCRANHFVNQLIGVTGGVVGALIGGPPGAAIGYSSTTTMIEIATASECQS